MNVLIIEDEKIAADHLEMLLKSKHSDIQIMDKLESVRRAVAFLKEEQPQLIFMDIQLADGLSFEIFEQLELKVPVIFTTAYDHYALQAFKVNSVDYLLKPIDEEELARAMQKFQSVYQQESSNADLIELTRQMLQKEYKKRYMVKKGNHIRSLAIEDIAYFHSAGKNCFAESFEHEEYLLDYTLDQLELFSDPNRFFRINRKYIICIDAIEDIIPYSGNRLKVKLKACKDPDVLVSRERVRKFKQWLG